MEIEQKKMRALFGRKMKLLFFIGGRTVTERELFTIHMQISFDEWKHGMTVFCEANVCFSIACKLADVERDALVDFDGLPPAPQPSTRRS